jgi:hypothetical protein
MIHGKTTTICCRSFVILILCLILVACGAGPRLAGLQAEFEQLYLVRLEMEENTTARPGPADAEDIEHALRELSIEARQAAEDRNLQTPTRIAFLRLALIAAWQGKEQNQGYIDGIVDKGNALCASLTPKEPTRDCALFLILPTAIASSNIPSSSAKKWSQLFNDGESIPAEQEEEVATYFNDMKKVVVAALETFSNNDKLLQLYLSRHGGLLEYYKEELTRYYARLDKARDFALIVEGKPEGVISENDKAFTDCVSVWVDEVCEAPPNTSSDNLRRKAKQCLKQLEEDR